MFRYMNVRILMYIYVYCVGTRRPLLSFPSYASDTGGLCDPRLFYTWIQYQKIQMGCATRYKVPSAKNGYVRKAHMPRIVFLYAYLYHLIMYNLTYWVCRSCIVYRPSWVLGYNHSMYCCTLYIIYNCINCNRFHS